MLFSKFKQPLVNSTKAASEKPAKPNLFVFSDANMKPSSAGPPVTASGSGQGNETRTRQEFEKVWPKRHQKQVYHLNQLKVNKLPVHISSPLDRYTVPAVYAMAVVCTCLSITSIINFAK